MQSNLLFAPTSLCVFFPSFPLLTLKSHEVAGLFGLPSDDAYAVLQTQNALNGHRRTERRCAVLSFPPSQWQNPVILTFFILQTSSFLLI